MSNFVRQFRVVFLFSLAVGLLFLAGSFPVYAQVHESDIVINEIMYNPSTSTDFDGEWFEVANTSSSPMDINGWCIKDSDGETHTITASGGSLVVPANGYLVLGRNNTSSENGGLSLDYEYGTEITLVNSPDEIVLLDAACGTSPSNEQDRVEYDDNSPWPSEQNGHAIMFCFGSNSNNNGDEWQLADTNASYGDGSNYGTPGAENNNCGPTAIRLKSLSSTTSNADVKPLAGLLFAGAVLAIVGTIRQRQRMNA